MSPLPLDLSTVLPTIPLPPIFTQEHPKSIGHRVLETLQKIIKTVYNKILTPPLYCPKFYLISNHVPMLEPAKPLPLMLVTKQ